MNITTVIMLVVLAGLIFFMFRNSRKRQRTQAELREQMVPGAEVMTNFGMYGKLLSVDDEDNTALVETTPGTIIKVHRQALSRVVEAKETETPGPELNAGPTVESAPLSDPEYGERLGDASAKRRKKDD